MRPRVFALPEGPPLQLSLTPRLESWERHDHPAQVALREFVAHVRELVDPVIERTRGELAVRLDVGLPHAVDPLWERDLDNYLFPIARVMPERVVSVWATKRRDPQSFVRVERAAEVTAPAGWQRFEVPRAPGSERYWKAAVRRAVSGAEELAAGPVGLQLALAVGPERNWTGMWKASIDGLEPLLGKTYEDRIWNPQDGRVVRLGLHRTVDYSLGHDASMTLWARPGDEGWPELRWLAQMEPDERELLLRARQPRPSVMPKPAVATSGERHRAGQPRTAETVDAGGHETVEIFRDDDDGYLALGWLSSHGVRRQHPTQRQPVGRAATPRDLPYGQRRQPAPGSVDRSLRQGVLGRSCKPRRLGSRACRFAYHPLWNVPAAASASLAREHPQ